MNKIIYVHAKKFSSDDNDNRYWVCPKCGEKVTIWNLLADQTTTLECPQCKFHLLDVINKLLERLRVHVRLSGELCMEDYNLINGGGA